MSLNEIGRMWCHYIKSGRKMACILFVAIISKLEHIRDSASTLRLNVFYSPNSALVLVLKLVKRVFVQKYMQKHRFKKITLGS